MRIDEAKIQELVKIAHTAKLDSWKELEFSRVCRSLQVHTKGMLFDKVDKLYPNENPDSKRHCIDTYAAITQGSIWKSIDNVQRIFANSSFSVSASDNTLLSVNENRFEGMTLFNWFVKNWVESTIGEDPNCFFASYHPEYLKKHPGKPIRIISTEHVRKYNDEMVIIVSADESKTRWDVEDERVMVGTRFNDPNLKGAPNVRLEMQTTYNRKAKQVIERAVYHVFTKDFLLRIEEDENGDFDYEIYYYRRPANSLYCFKVSAPEISGGVCESFVAPFIPWGDLALIQHRSHRAVDLMFSYPRLSEIETPCDADSCVNGYVDDKKCQRCGGAGYVVEQSPYKTYRKKIDSGLSDPELVKAILSAPPVTFHTPDTGILEYSKKSWREYLELGEEAVYVPRKQTTGNPESAESKRIGQEGEYNWNSKISKALHTDLKKVLQAQEDFINANPVQVDVEQPTSFALVTEGEAFEALSTIIGSTAPVVVKAHQVDTFVYKYVSRNSPFIKALEILKKVDPLLYYSSDEIEAFCAAGVVKKESWATHIHAYPTLMRMYMYDKMLFTKDSSAIEKMLLDEISKVMPEPDKETENLKRSILDKVA